MIEELNGADSFRPEFSSFWVTRLPPPLDMEVCMHVVTSSGDFVRFISSLHSGTLGRSAWGEPAKLRYPTVMADGKFQD